MNCYVKPYSIKKQVKDGRKGDVGVGRVEDLQNSERILFTYFMYEVFVLISLVKRNAGVEILESHVAKTLGLWLSFVCVCVCMI